MQNNDGYEFMREYARRLGLAFGIAGLLTGVRPPDADTPDDRQSDDPTGGRSAAEHSASTTGRPAADEPLGRVEVDGVTWVYVGQDEPLWARKCQDRDCSQCGHLPGPYLGCWLALTGPLADLADQDAAKAPPEPETATEGPSEPWPGFAQSFITEPVTIDGAGNVRLGGRLLGQCDCPRCERGRARMSARPDTPGD